MPDLRPLSRLVQRCAADGILLGCRWWQEAARGSGSTLRGALSGSAVWARASEGSLENHQIDMSEQTATWMRGDVVEFDLEQEGIAYQRCGLVIGFEEPAGPLHSSLVRVRTVEGTVHVLPSASLRKAAVSGMTEPGLARLLTEFRERRDLLKSYREQTFPSGTPVLVDCKRYTGPGTVVHDSDCPLDW